MTLEEIEKSISKFSPEELALFCAWFEEFEAYNWDRQIERDIKAGKLDKFADEALEDLRKGHTRIL